MANSPSEKPRLGQRLVEVGLLSAADLEEALQKQRETGLPLGRMLVEGGYVPGHSVAMALADQHGGLLKTEYGFATGWSGALPARPLEPLRTEQPTANAETSRPTTGLRVVQPSPPEQPTPDVEPSRPISGLRIAEPPADAELAELRVRNEELQAQLRAREQAAPPDDGGSGRRWRLFGR